MDRARCGESRWGLDVHARGHAILGHDRRGRALDDQQASLTHEGGEFRHAFPSHAASDVVALVDSTQVGCLFALPVGKWQIACHGEAVDVRLRVPAHVRVDDDVVPFPKIAFGDELVGEVVVRHAVVVERATHPALVLCATPRVQKRDARNVELVGPDLRHVVRAVPLQSELRQARLQHRAVRVGNDERARCERAAVHLELLFGREHPRPCVPEAERHEIVVRRMVDHHDAATA